MFFSTRTRRLATLLPVAAFSLTGVNAFSPMFSNPRQCGALTVSWSSFDGPESLYGASSVSISLVPLESAAHHTPEPFIVDIPCHEAGGEYTIPALPFPHGTQFFASAHIPAAAGPVRRRVSTVLTVGISHDSSCLPNQVAPSRWAKSFGRRQISEIGVGAVDVNQPPAPPAPSGAAVPIRVIGESNIPAAGRIETPENAAAPPPGQANGAPVPPIREIGVGTIPANNTGDEDAAGNDAVIDENAPTTTFFAPEPVITDVNQETGDDYYGEYNPYNPYEGAAPEEGTPEDYHLPIEDVMPEEEHDVPEEYHVPVEDIMPEEHDLPYHERPQETHVSPGASFVYTEPQPWVEELYQEGRVWDYEYVHDAQESVVEVMPEVHDPYYASHY